jgi:hypothetical protein
MFVVSLESVLGGGVFGGFIFRGVFRWLWCSVYMRHHLYLAFVNSLRLAGIMFNNICRLKKKKKQGQGYENA